MERNGWKFGTPGSRNSICRVPLVSGHLSSVWCDLVYFAKTFSMLRFSKGHCSHSFPPVSTTSLYGKHDNQWSITFGEIRQIMAVWFFSYHRTIIMGLETSKRYSSYTSHPISAKLYEDIGYRRWIQAFTFLGNGLRFKNFVALKIWDTWS